MGKDSGIEWTHHTHNLFWGCVKVASGCKNCYAEDWMDAGQYWGVQAPRRFFKDAHYRQPLAWNRAAARAGERHRVFCMSMGDLFEIHQNEDVNWHMNERRNQLWRMIADTPNLDWLLLTKRLENVLSLVPLGWNFEWPRNAWLGFSASTQKELDKGAQELAQILNQLEQRPPVTFVSLEPLLELVDVSPYLDYTIQKGETGYGERANSLQPGAVGGMANRRLGAGMDEEEGGVEEGGTQAATGVSSGQEDDKLPEDTYGCAQACLPSFQGRDTGRLDDQSQEWQKGRQQTGESGSGNLLRESEACIQDWSDQSGWSEESSQQVDESANRGDTEEVCTGRSDTGRTGKRISRGLSDDLKDSEGGSLPESAWPDSELYPSQGKWQQETRFRRTIQFVIVGGESGKHARLMHPGWVRQVRDDCIAADVPFFFKQWGEWVYIGNEYDEADKQWVGPMQHVSDGKTSAIMSRVGKKQAGDVLDGRQWHQFPEVDVSTVHCETCRGVTDGNDSTCVCGEAVP